MKISSTISRYLLGLVFLVFGLNGFLHFIPMGPVPPLALQFAGALAQSHYMTVIFLIQIACAGLLLANRFIPLAVAILAPVIANIDLFHIFMAPGGLPLAFLVTVLWAIVAYSVRFAFSGIFANTVTTAAATRRVETSALQR